MLAEEGATVYCTGRSRRTQPNTSNHVNAGRPETIEETAEMDWQLAPKGDSYILLRAEQAEDAGKSTIAKTAGVQRYAEKAATRGHG